MSPALRGALLAGFATFTALLTLALLVSWRTEVRIRQRLHRQLGGLQEESKEGIDPVTAIILRAAAEEPLWIRHLLARHPFFRGLQQLFRAAGLEWRLRRFFWYSAGWALIGGMLAAMVRGFSPLLVVGAVCGGAVPLLFARHMRTSRLASFEGQLAEAIDLLARALRAGHPLSAGFKLVADEAPDPAGAEFRRVFEEQRFGLTVEESLHSLIRRMDLLDVRMLVTAILIQRDVGGNLAEILDGLASTIRTRFAIVGKVRTHTAQARMSGYVVGLLPFAVGSLMFLVNPDAITPLFRYPLGRLILTFAFALQALGILWIRAIVNVRY